MILYYLKSKVFIKLGEVKLVPRQPAVYEFFDDLPFGVPPEHAQIDHPHGIAFLCPRRKVGYRFGRGIDGQFEPHHMFQIREVAWVGTSG